MARLDDGHSTTYSFSSHSTATFWEKTVTPPGIEVGSVDTTTMRNTTWRTRNAKKLKSLTESSVTCAFDPAFMGSGSGQALLGVNQSITVHWPDGHTLVFWGFLSSIKFNALVEGEQPTAELTIFPTNQDGSGVEQPPVES